MRRITEFKGYRTIIAYDAEAKCFSTRRVASAMDVETANNVNPEPEHHPQK